MTRPGSKPFPFSIALGILILVGALFYFYGSSKTVAPAEVTAVDTSRNDAVVAPSPVSAAPANLDTTATPAQTTLSSPTEPPPIASPETAGKVRVLREIINGHGDNDPRMDTELLHLDAATKRAFRAEYEHTVLERRNARGTIVFLLGRNLTSPEDFAFMKSVLSEPPCLSMQDCRGTANDPIGEGAAEHDDGAVNEKVLNYPSAMALESIARELQNGAFDASQKAQTIPVLEQGTASKVPFVARRSRELLNTLTESH
jgi:hypothetical protein